MVLWQRHHDLYHRYPLPIKRQRNKLVSFLQHKWKMTVLHLLVQKLWQRLKVFFNVKLQGQGKPEVPVIGCAPVVSFCCRGFISMISKVTMQEKIQKRLKFQDFNICPHILHADGNMDAGAGGIAIALLHLSAGALKKWVCLWNPNAPGGKKSNIGY